MNVAAKYHPLFEHLLYSGRGEMKLSFREIEAIIGAQLPPSARERAEWWSNSERGHSQARAWMRASYRASGIDLNGETVIFRLEGWPEEYGKAGNMRPSIRAAGLQEKNQEHYEANVTSGAGQTAQHPLFGIWKHKVTLLEGHDYTRPAFLNGD
jgi:hypothetical protein